MRTRLFLLLIVCVHGAFAGSVDFQSDVRPVLSDACFHCHGPDPETRMFGLRLDTQEGAFGERDNGAPIIPGDPENSLIYKRITAEAPMQMPPPQAHKDLTTEQIETIRLWIEEGAEWEEHWAFTAPEKHEPPTVKEESWVRNPIDNFILGKLEAQGLQPAPEADRRTLARRLALDLTGLPPTPEELAAFLADESPDAYEQLVERMMAKPAWGEHRARYWLDAARYADTHGLHIDNYREMWPYRDWVIDAFNDNMPFDDFTIEQIAGDMLEDPTRAQLIATGFHRCNVTTNEGGVIDEEVAAMYDKDRVDTTSTVWLGLTVGCATCHDHKFDPITQKDFYSMAAFFRNTTQAPRDGNIYDTPPVILVASDEDQAVYDELTEAEPKLRRELGALGRESYKDIYKWVKQNKKRTLEVGAFDDSEIFTLRVADRPAALFNGAAHPLEMGEKAAVADGPREGSKALLINEEGEVEIEGFPGFDADEPFTIAIEFFAPEGDEPGRLLSKADPNDEQRGWALEISNDRPMLSFEADRSEQLAVRAQKDHKVSRGEWNRVVATYDGSRSRTGIRLFLNGQAVPVDALGNAIHIFQGPLDNDGRMLIGARDGEEETSYSEGWKVSDIRFLDRAIGEADADLLAYWPVLQRINGEKVKGRDEAGRDALRAWYLAKEKPEYYALAKRLDANVTKQAEILRRTPVTHVQEEKMDSEPFAHILFRGEYDQPRERVEALTPGVLPPMLEDQPQNRLGLARWLVDDRNPLTARVTVNRFWQQVFGRGIVETAEDFGSQGEAPTHPELLDWLALEFRDSGWDVKDIFRLIVTSATYRQSAAASPLDLEKDPRNKLLSRGPRFRMDGEMVRDYALAAGDLLHKEVGGPSVKPYQPSKIWETVAMRGSNTRFYFEDNGDGLYRRSLYTFWKRSAPPPNMEIFNAPTREHCTVRRERTNTPLQALVTMNDPQFVEAARHLADNAYRQATDIDGRIDFMTARLLARRLTDRERQVARNAYREYMRHYDSTPDDAGALLSVGESSAPEGPTAELAALTMLANQLLNLDEVLNK